MTRAYFNTAQALLRQVAKHVLQNIDRVDRIKQLAHPDTEVPVTSVALDIENEITDRLQSLYPTHSILLAYGGLKRAIEVDDEDQYHWVCDPLDGINNLMCGLPCMAISLALFHNRRCVLSLVYQPVTDDLFTASTGEGALLNGKKIRARKQKHQHESLIMMSGTGTVAQAIDEVQDMSKIAINMSNIRQLGSTSLSLALHASGAADLFYARNISICSMAAGLHIASEAGARIKKSQQNDLQMERVISLLAQN